MIQGSIPHKTKGFFSLPKVSSPCLGVERPRHEVDSVPTSVEVKNELRYISTPHVLTAWPNTILPFYIICT